MRSLYGDGSTAIRRERKQIRNSFKASRSGANLAEKDKYGVWHYYADERAKPKTSKERKESRKKEKAVLRRDEYSMVDRKSVNQVAKRTAAKKSTAKKTVARKKK